MKKDFCRLAIEDLVNRIDKIPKDCRSLHHMLVLPEGETVKVPTLGVHAVGGGNYKPPGPYEFGSSKVATTLAERSLADECKNGPMNSNIAIQTLIEIGSGLVEVATLFIVTLSQKISFYMKAVGS